MNNFAAIATVINQNHVNFNATGQGKHAFLQMPVQGSAPTTLAGEGAVYVKNDGSSVPQLFWRAQSNGAEQQITNPTVVSASTGGGTSFALDTVFGLKFKWGSFLSGQIPDPGFTATINFAGTAFSNTNYAIIAILQAPGASGETVVIQAGKTPSTVVLKTKDTANNGYYIAIGV